MVKIFKVNKPLLSDLLSFPLMGLDCSIFFHHSPSLEKDLCCTVELRLTVTSLMRSPRYYGHFFLSRRKAHTFFNTKTPLTRPPRFTANSEIPTCIILYKLPHHTTIRTSCVHLCIVHISYTDSSFNL